MKKIIFLLLIPVLIFGQSKLKDVSDRIKDASGNITMDSGSYIGLSADYGRIKFYNNFLSFPASQRLFWGTIGDSIGLRNNAGTMQYRNSGGAWADIASSAAAAGGWTDDGTVVRSTTGTDDLVWGGTTVAASAFAVDESDAAIHLGADNSANAKFYLEATDGDIGLIEYNTNDALNLTGMNLGLDVAYPQCKIDVNGGIQVRGQEIPTSGSGIWFYYNGTKGGLSSIDWDTSTYKTLAYNALSHELQLSGSIKWKYTEDGQKIEAAINCFTDTSTVVNEIKIYDVDEAVQNNLTGLKITVLMVANNTGACTLKLGASSARPIKVMHDQDPGASYFEAGGYYDFIFDGTNWQCLTPDSNP